MDTIFALSSGSPPAAIAVMRISGPRAFAVLSTLTGRPLPTPRTATLRTLKRDTDASVLDQALVLTFPGPTSATGEDVVELHLHGGRAVVAADAAALEAQPDIRQAEPGEFTRRGLAAGRIDLAQAEGLGDLLAAETELQRRVAIGAAGGLLSQWVEQWRQALLTAAALVESAIDFAEEGDLPVDSALLSDARARVAAVSTAAHQLLANPSAERIRDGFRVVIAGPPNSGKSTLINAMAARDVAIVTPIAGTTRDVIEAPVSRAGLPFVLTDTAGLRDADDHVEAIGVDRARSAIKSADLVLWLGDEEPAGEEIWIHARCDLPGRQGLPCGPILAVSGATGCGLSELWQEIVNRVVHQWRSDDVALNLRQRQHVRAALDELDDGESDPLILAEGLRRANQHLAQITGASATEDMLDTLFSRFCLGK